jgi:hypothetical protein
MDGIKIFPRTAMIVCLAVFFAARFNYVNGQGGAKKGSFFTQRLTVSQGLDYSFVESNVPATAGVNFIPQLFLTNSFKDLSVSIAAGVMMNYRWEENVNTAGEKIFLVVPSMLHLNIGHGASKDFHSAAGGFAGAGWNVQSDGAKTVNGFALDAGFRFWLFGKSFTLGFVYFPSTEKIFSSGKIIFLQINLGKYLEDVKVNNKVSNFMKPYQK